MTDRAARLARGTRVRLAPSRRADLLDVALAGREAVVERVEEDVDGTLHVGVILDGDHALELGPMRQIGHRFFFSPDELEPIAETRAPAVLVAALGDAFAGDGAFGGEVVERLRLGPLPRGVRAADFGIRRRDLAHALGDGYDAVIVVGALALGGPPGHVRVIESGADAALRELGLDAASLPGAAMVVAYEPDGGGDGMSAAARAAVPVAVREIEALAGRLAAAQ